MSTGDDEPQFVIEKVTSRKPTAANTLQPFWVQGGAGLALGRATGEFFPLSRSRASAVIVGQDVQTDSLVRIGEEERCGGVYILGKPRTGKSTLLVSMALTDIRNGYGILFIDPHTDAINELRGRIPESRRKDIILLDPTDCRDNDSERSRPRGISAR